MNNEEESYVRAHAQKKHLDMAWPCATNMVIAPFTSGTVKVDG